MCQFVLENSILDRLPMSLFGIFYVKAHFTGLVCPKSNNF